MMQKQSSVRANHNFVSLLQKRAEQTPNACAYVFLTDGEHLEQSISYQELDARVKIIAAHLQANSNVGERALLLYPPGLDYIISFFACLYAGVVAVPVYPPSRHHLQRLKAIIFDAAPAIVLTTGEWSQKLQDSYQESWGQKKLVWLATDEINNHASTWISRQLKSDNLAFLQYTSGSTGNPKGVMVSHGNLMANQKAIQKAFGHSRETVVVGWLPFYHDMGLIGNILQPLYLGSTAILMSPMVFLEKPIRWLNTISKYRATTSGGPNFAYELCIRKIAPEQISTIDLSCWTLAFNGSEPVRTATLERFAHVFSQCGFRQKAFYPCYGLAEATLFVTGQGYATESNTESNIPLITNDSNRLAQTLVNCGHTSTGHKVCIVNPESKSLCPDGEEGEIWINGASVAQGYWNQPEVSEETFRAVLTLPQDYSAPEKDQKTYLRTGDLGILKQGGLYVTGRIKDLIILRGHNYYPHDFEQAIDSGVPELRPGCSAAFSINQEDEETLIIVAEAKRRKIDGDKAQKILIAMRQALINISDAPIGVIVLVPPGVVPKTSSGKIRRQACKQDYLAQRLQIIVQSGENTDVHALISEKNEDNTLASLVSLRETVRISTKEQRISLITNHILSHLVRSLRIPEADLKPETAIRSVGLDSLRIVELKHSVDLLLDTDASLTLFMSDHSIHTVAEILASIESADSTLDMQELPSGKSVIRSCSAEVSYAQKAMWMVHQLESESVAYNLHFALRLEGALKPGIIQQAFDRLLDRHDQLCTYYDAIDDDVIQIHKPRVDWPEYFTTIDASNWTEKKIQADFTQRINEPFDLANGPVLHVVCYCLDEDRHVLLFCAHHIAVDLRSTLILLNDLKSILEQMITGQAICLPKISATYQDFVAWQKDYLLSSVGQTDWKYWQNRLSGTLPILALPTDFPKPKVPTYRGASHVLKLNRDLTHKIKQLGQQHGATLFMTLLAVYNVMLFRYTHHQDIIVGTASSGRSQARFLNTVGNFVNPIALRSYPHSNLTFAQYLAQVRDTVLESLSHANYPFSLLVEQLQPQRSVDHWPVYQTWFGLQQDQVINDKDDEFAHFTLGTEHKSQEWGQWKLAPKEINAQIENFDLRLMAAENEAGLLLSFKYRSDLFKAETIARMADHFQVLLEGALAKPETGLGEMSLLTETEQVQQVNQWNATSVSFPKSKNLHSLFERQVKETPTQVAVSCEGASLTYTELNTRANQLAQYLRRLGVESEVVVGLCFKRSLDMFVGILGVLKAGGAYVPIEPNFPMERVTAILVDAKASVLITHQNFADGVMLPDVKIVHMAKDYKTISARPRTNLQTVSTPEHLAYIIYTSGSTGKPKGVAVTHANIVNSTLARSHYYQDNVDGFLLLSSYTFDSSMAGIFWTLSQGGCVFIPSDGGEKDPQILGGLLSTEKITHLLCLPSLYAILLESIPLKYFSRLRTIIVAGEACSSRTITQHHLNLPHTDLFNEYGPTESAVWSSVYHLQSGDEDRVVPIGKPIPNVQIYLLDNRLNLVPIGVTGEIYISGVGLARGYQRQSALTAAQFIPNPFGVQPGERLYRVGDLARYRADGNIEYLGRTDHQVKIRGFRIELGEIEAALLGIPQIKAAVVLARQDSPEAKRLVAYIVGGESTLNIEEVRIHLKTQLPEYMVPVVFVILNEMPLTANGKVNRKELPKPDISSLLALKHVAPKNQTEETLAKIWAELLDLEQIGVHDNFFELGGDSILSIQATALARQHGLIHTPQELFQHQTVTALAAATKVDEPVKLESCDQEAMVGELPLTPIQRWFFSQTFENLAHWNQSVMLDIGQLNSNALKQAVLALQWHHDSLRLRFYQKNHRWHQYCSAESTSDVVHDIDLSALSTDVQTDTIMSETAKWQASLNLEQGPLWRVVNFNLGKERTNRLLIIIHHLAVDGVSWRILLQDFQIAYQQAENDVSITLPDKTSSYKHWAECLYTHSGSNDLQAELPYWRTVENLSNTLFPVDNINGENLEKFAVTVRVTLDTENTDALLHTVPATYRTQINDLLLTAFVQTLSQWVQSESIQFDLEGHGREALFDSVDLSRTLGWFTSIFPVAINLPNYVTSGEAIKIVKEQLRAIPNNGIGYALLRYQEKSIQTESLGAHPDLQIGFNYLGQFDQLFQDGSDFALVEHAPHFMRAACNKRNHELDIDACVVNNRLQLDWTYSNTRYNQSTIENLAHNYIAALKALIQHCLSEDSGGYTPSDFPLTRLRQANLDTLYDAKMDVEDIYPLAPLQQGLIFHSQLASGSGIYCNQFSCMLVGDLNVEVFLRTWQQLVDEHAVLRTAFNVHDQATPEQIVYRKIKLPIERLDWRELSSEDQLAAWYTYQAKDRQNGFSFTQAPLMRLSLIQCAQNKYYFLWSYHHVLLDGWCIPLIFKEVFGSYETLKQNETFERISKRPYRDYIAWLQTQDMVAAEIYWKSTMQGFNAPTELGIDRFESPHSGSKDYLNYRFVLSTESNQQFQAFVKQHQLTLNTLVQSAWALLLSRYSNNQDIVFGITVSGRPAELVGVEQMVGLFINALPLRVRLSSETSVREWLHALLEQNLDLRQYEYTPLADIHGWSDVPRGEQLFESLLVFENYPIDWTLETQAATLGMHQITFSEQADYPLTFVITSTPKNGLSFELIYQQHRFEKSSIARMAGHFERLLEAIISAPDRRLHDLCLLPASEREQLLLEWNATDTAYSQDTYLHQLFEAQVDNSPGLVAVAFEDRQLTYGQLNAQANQLAHYLRAQGVGPEVLVGICVERSLEMIIGILGILKAGGAYLPIDPNAPRERIVDVLEITEPALILSQQKLHGLLPQDIKRLYLDTEWKKIAGEKPDNLDRQVSPQNLAYVLYTSGSTGKPKGVAITHRNVVNSTLARLEYYQQPISSFLLLSSMTFDSSIAGLFGTLSQGGCLILPHDDLILDTKYLLKLISNHEISHMLAVPSLYKAVLNHPASAGAKSLKTVIVAGESCHKDLIDLHYQLLPQAQLFNEYGPTEATVWSTVHRCKVDEVDQKEPVPIGRPIANTQIYLLDEYLNPVPIGISGELYIGGIGLARGYQDHSALTAERFIPNPFDAQAGGRLYCTGDLARYRADGNIEFLGRTDHQVKIRGFRIELGEVEVALLQHAQIKEAVAIVREDNPEDKRLVAYVVCTESAPGIEDIRTQIKTRLPEYMIPTAFVFLDHLPLTSNGKVDREALPVPDGSDQLTHEYVAPRNPTEEILANIWAEVLGVERVGIHDNFFELGGHSLLVMQVISRIQALYAIEIPLITLFEEPTVSKLTVAIESISLNNEEFQIAPITAISRETPLSLSYAQERLWFLDQLESNSAFYNISGAIRLLGALDTIALSKSLNEIINRHEVLRTTFSVREGGSVEQVIAPSMDLDMAVIDLSDVAENKRRTEVSRYLAEEAQRPFDLSQGPLVRATLLSLGEPAAPDNAEHILLFTLHHIISDGWSTGILIREFVTLYEAYSAAQPSPLPELTIQYADYAVWQRDWLQDERLAQQLNYWTEQLAGAPAVLELPTDRPRPTVQSYRGASYHFSVSQTVTEQLKLLSRQEEATLFMVLLTSFNILLFRYSGQKDICVGMPIANRSRVEIEGLIGLFVNTLVLRTDLSDDPVFTALLRSVREICLGAQAHQDLPFEKLVEELAPVRDMSRSPLFQVMFTLQNASDTLLDIDDLQIIPVNMDTGAVKFDLDLEMTERSDGLDAIFNYNTDLFDESTIARMAGHFERLLEAIVSAPDKRLHDLCLLTGSEREQLLLDWNATEASYSQDTCLHQLFESQVGNSPEMVAVVFEDQQLTYGQLNAQANQLAHYLRAQGVGPEVLVGICVERSLEMIIGILGILKAGGAYMPIDPSYPQERIVFMVEDAQPAMVLIHPSTREVIPDSIRIIDMEMEQEAIVQWSDHNPVHLSLAQNLAYAIYTSGSTGKPKGSGLVHQGVVNRLEWMQKQYQLGAHDRILQKTPFSFDVSVWELFWPILEGARQIIAPPDAHKDVIRIVEIIKQHEITILHFVPSMLSAFLDMCDVTACQSLRHVICSGEALSASIQQRFFKKLPVQLHNLYGPTEASIDVTMWACKSNSVDSIIPIGRPIDNTQIYLFDAYLNPVPVGVPGELYIGGVGLARCYQNRAALTAERFIPSPFSVEPGERLYRTGDLARYRADGNIEYLGRTDHQVKIRGFRIELGEIETALLQHAQIKEAIAIVREDNPEDKRLVAYVVCTESAPGIEDIRAQLQTRLPDHMIPTAFVFLEDLPLTSNGKLDRKALPAPDGNEQLAHEYVAPRNPTEEIIANIWAEVLGVERVGIHDNFFELGGHSLLALKLLERMRHQGLHADVRQLFVAPRFIEFVAAISNEETIEVPENRIHQHCELITPEILPLVVLNQTEINSIAEQIPGGMKNVQDIYPLTPFQEGILFHHLINSEGDAYLQSSLLAFDTYERLKSFLNALQKVINRHDILRTAIIWENLPEPVQVVVREASLPITEVNIDTDSGDASKQLQEKHDPRQVRLDIRQAPLLHGYVARDAVQKRWLLLILNHHLAVDHMALEMLLDEVQVHLSGQLDQLLKPLPFRNFVAQTRMGIKSDEHRAFFHELLGNVTEPTAPFGLLDVQNDGSNITEAFLDLDTKLIQRIHTCTRGMGVNTASFFHLAWARVLAQISVSKDVVFGTVLFGRLQNNNATSQALGIFINTLPVHINFDEMDIKEAIWHMHKLLAELIRHEHASLTLAQHCSAVPAQTPLFSALLNYRHSKKSEADDLMLWPGVELLSGEERTNYPITLSIDDFGEDFRLTAQVQAPIDPQNICRYMHTTLVDLVDALEVMPDKAVCAIEVLPVSERNQLLLDWNATETAYSQDTCLHQLFESQVGSSPEMVAVVFEDQQLTYGQLNAQANQLAHYLRAQGVGPEVLVGICVERSLEMIIGILGIL